MIQLFDALIVTSSIYNSNFYQHRDKMLQVLMICFLELISSNLDHNNYYYCALSIDWLNYSIFTEFL